MIESKDDDYSHKNVHKTQMELLESQPLIPKSELSRPAPRNPQRISPLRH